MTEDTQSHDPEFGTPLFAEEDISQPIDALNKAFNSVRDIFTNEIKSMRTKTLMFLLVSVIFIGTIVAFYIYIIFYNGKPNFSGDKNEIIYDISVRIVVISFMVSLIAFCLKMMRVYLSLYERARHKYAIISSLPTLVYAGKDPELFKSSYTKIVDMLIEIGKEEPIGKEDELKLATTSSLIKELLKKKEE